MEQQIRFCTTSDGVRIAYATMGKGSPPLVVVSAWLSHLQVEWRQPDIRSFWEGLANGRRVIRYDKRGVGLSDRDVADLSFESRVRDLEAVINATGIERCDLVGMSEGGPTSIAYIARYPEKVNRLVLYGSYPRMPVQPDLWEPLLALIRAQWGMGSAALASAFVPYGDAAHVAAFNELQRVAASGVTAAKIIEETLQLDVTPLLPHIKVPTLVIHRKDDAIHPLDLARELATLIPDARLEAQEGEIYSPWWGDSESVLNAIDEFLGEGQEVAAAAELAAAGGLCTILFTDIEGSTSLTQRLGDAKAQEVLWTHNRIVRDALRAHGGSEVKTMGDGFMASFSSATGALQCAIAMQRAFAAHNESAEEPIRVRVGLNAGEPIAEEKDLFGTAVIMAARIAGKAAGGEILASDVVRQLVAGKGFHFADRGEVVLRGFEDPVRLFEVRWREG